MRLFVLTSLTMLAFAANSVLNRMALADNLIDPISFAVIRLGSGALILTAIVLLRRQRLPILYPARLVGVVALLAYMFGFSTAYQVLDTGLGALILFAGVQITMFAGAIISREPISRWRWSGTALAMGGLAWLLWPGSASTPPVIGVISMSIAALGWGIFSLAGRNVVAPLPVMAATFLLAAIVALGCVQFLPVQLDATRATARGWGLAILSGGATSGLGYALWYAVLPRLATVTASVAQLTVPVIALAGGVLFLGETASLTFLLASALIFTGIGLSLKR